MIIPPYLQKGDRIGLVCPSGYMPAGKYRTAMEVLGNWGYEVQPGYTAGHQHNYFSGTDEERLDDLQQMMDDPGIRAVFCARGGYGLSRIIDDLDFRKFRRHPKWIIGFSDITVLHAHITERFGIATLHAPMAAAFNDGGYRNKYVQSLRLALSAAPSAYSVKGNKLNRRGRCEGPLVGGNLALVAHLAGSKSSYRTAGKILFLEDVGEYLYNIDRMLIQLKRAGMLENLAGLIFGGFSDLKDTTLPFGCGIQEILQQHVAEYKYPVCFDFPVSHEKENYALKVGVKHRLEIGSAVKLTELT